MHKKTAKINTMYLFEIYLKLRKSATFLRIVEYLTRKIEYFA